MDFKKLEQDSLERLEALVAEKYPHLATIGQYVCRAWYQQYPLAPILEAGDIKAEDLVRLVGGLRHAVIMSHIETVQERLLALPAEK
ncbi:MAG: hypothetical protein IH614_13640 [Desulfuromonadales bacterium]|nr:hypothetical protein [Desulfuromonadales bacterium]